MDTPGSGTGDPQPVSATLDVIWDEIKTVLVNEDAQLQVLDTKAGLALGSGTLLAAGVTAFQAGFKIVRVVPGSGNTLSVVAAVILYALLATVFALYIALVNAGFRGYGLRSFREIRDIGYLNREFRTSPPDDAKRALIAAAVRADAQNRNTIAQKEQAASDAVKFLYRETLAVTALVLYQLLLTLAT